MVVVRYRGVGRPAQVHCSGFDEPLRQHEVPLRQQVQDVGRMVWRVETDLAQVVEALQRAGDLRAASSAVEPGSERPCHESLA